MITMKKLLKLLLATVMSCTSFQMMELQASLMPCSETTSYNEDAHDYTVTASPINTYLSKTNNGWMRFVNDRSVQGYQVDFFDENFVETNRLFLDQQLPIFGAFYESSNHYYIVSGQTNYDENNSLEVVRVSKYDKQWKHLKDCSISGINTTVPFDGGSVRLDDDGTYLVIRTAHEMYTSSDGYNHQSNMTLQIKMDDMTLSDSYSKVSNMNYGYVSHSFNQFIQTDGDYLVTLDHGDAHPRAFVVMQYKTNYKDGKFTSIKTSDVISSVKVFNFSGQNGQNSTGASAGGLEVSSTHYLMVGNSEVQDGSFSYKNTRNVFVGRVNKSTLETSYTYLTDLEEGVESATTPLLVKINDQSFVVLYEVNNQLYYQMLDNEGNSVTNAQAIAGSLSDCHPVVVGNTLNWFVYRQDETTFYTLNVQSGEFQSKTVNTGHQYVHTSNVKDGYIELQCDKCQKESSVSSFTNIETWWNDAGAGMYSSIFNGKRNVGETVYYMLTTSEGTQEAELSDEIQITLSNPNVLAHDADVESFTPLRKGTCTVTFASKYNPNMKVTKTFVIDGGDYQGTLTSSAGTDITLGTKTTLKLDVTNLDRDAQYCFIDKDTDDVLRAYSEKNTYSFTPKTAGTQTIIARMKDEDGNIFEQEITLNYHKVIKNKVTLNDFTLSYKDGTYNGLGHPAKYQATKDIPTAKITYIDLSDSSICDEPINAGTYQIRITFEETDTYDACEFALDEWKIVIAKKATPNNMVASTMESSHDCKKVSDIVLPENWQWTDSDINKKLFYDKAIEATARYVGKDRNNYLTTSVVVSIVRSEEHYGGVASCITLKVCEGCGASYGEYDNQNHIGDTYTSNKVSVSCKQEGYTGDIYCFDCDALLVKGDVIPQEDHEFDENTHLCIYCDKHMNDHYKEVLQALCDEVETYQRLDYSESTWSQLATVVMEGKALLNQQYANFNDYQPMIDAINSAIKNLTSSKPVVVKDLVLKAQNYKTLQLSWKAASEADYYDVYRLEADGSWKLIASVEDTGYKANVKTGVLYTYRVQAVNRIDDQLIYGDLSTEVSEKAMLYGKLVLKSELVTSNKIKLSWNLIDGATRYVIYRKEGTKSYKKVLTLGTNVNTYTSSILKPNTYSYIVKPARYDSISRVYGDQSNAVSEVTTFTKPVITLTKKSSSSIKVSWKKVDAASYYEVYRKVGSGAYKKLKNVSTTSYESKSLSKGKTYTYKVRAYTTVDGKKVYSTYSTAKSMKL